MLGLILAASLTGPAQAISPDPWEPMNRVSFAANEGMDRAVFRPLAISYKRILPREVRTAVRNFLSNWDEPRVAVNDILQLKPVTAVRTVTRFCVNSTLGVGGLMDPAKSLELSHHDNGFGRTLSVAGVGDGPYLYLPFWGPSDLREAVGAVVDLYSNPLTRIRRIRSKGVERSELVAAGLDQRAQMDGDLKTLRQTAVDPYATLRSYYLQRDQAEVSGVDMPLVDVPGETPPGAQARPSAQNPSSEFDRKEKSF